MEICGGEGAVSKTDHVYQELHRRIVGGNYSPGYRLVIDAVARDMGVSAMPVREAVRRLEAEGLVQYRPNVGAEVRGIDGRGLAEVQAVLSKLEGWLFEEASGHVGTEQLARLTALTHAMQAVLHEHQFEQYAAQEREFHRVIHDLAPNRYLVELIRHAELRVNPYDVMLYIKAPSRATQSLEDHYHLIQSLKENAPRAILGQLMEEHFRALFAGYPS